MLENYRVDDTAGVFVAPYLASLYTPLVARGSASSQVASGAAGEEIDLQGAIL